MTAFAVMLGAPNVVVGTFPAVMTLGWQLPSLFAAGHTQSLERKMPFVLRWTVWERVPFLVLAAVAFWLASSAPDLAIAVSLAMMLVVSMTGGALMPAWMDVVGRIVPVRARGRFFAVASVAGALGGFAGSFVTAYVLGALSGPRAYGVCFLIAAFFMGLSYVALALVDEPAGAPAAPPVRIATYLRQVPARLRDDPNFTWFLVARALAVVAAMAHAFYTVYALRRLDAALWQVGVFTTVLFAGQIVGNVAFGWLADRAGNRVVIIAGVLVTVVANVVALTTGLPAYTVVFAFAGLQMASVSVANQNVLLEFAPSVEERPTYIGVGNTLMAPVAFLSPLAAGTLADTVSFGAVFVVAALFGGLALVVLAARVRDPRHVAPLGYADVATQE
jgi:MFS family permease